MTALAVIAVLVASAFAATLVTVFREEERIGRELPNELTGKVFMGYVVVFSVMALLAWGISYLAGLG
jgi:hypothetical protein